MSGTELVCAARVTLCGYESTSPGKIGFMLASLPTLALATVAKFLPFETLNNMPLISKSVRESCDAIDGGWRTFVKEQFVLFKSGVDYVSRPAGLYNKSMIVYSVQKSGNSIIVNGSRCKLRMCNGVQFVYLGDKHNIWGTLRASDCATAELMEHAKANNKNWIESFL